MVCLSCARHHELLLLLVILLFELCFTVFRPSRRDRFSLHPKYPFFKRCRVKSSASELALHTYRSIDCVVHDGILANRF